MERGTRSQRLIGRGGGGGGGFTLTELLVVIGLITVLISMLLPTLGRVRAAANATTCMSNIRQMGTAWTMYLAENRGRLPELIGITASPQPDRAWRGYWPGILDTYGVRGETLMCPAADEPITFNLGPTFRGFGNIRHAWNGKFHTNGTVTRFNATTFRSSSYGYNRNLTAFSSAEPFSSGGFGPDGRATRINALRQPADVPVFFDAVTLDAAPFNGSPDNPVSSPPNLRWDGFPLDAPQHWRFLIARHGRGINAYFADGSTRHVPLDEAYMLTWNGSWTKYRLELPKY